MKAYDEWLDKATDDYLIGCQPKAINHNEDNMPDYNCEDCDNELCEHWLKYNDPSEIY